MKNVFLSIFLIISIMSLSTTVFAEENSWEAGFRQTLQKGNIQTENQSGGLGYTQDRDDILESAIKQAMELEAPPCDAMKIAVTELDYDAYNTIKNIFRYGGEINLDQLCGCATERGITGFEYSDAAKEAGYSMDEVAQAQCVKDVGLGYTVEAALPDLIEPDPDPNPESASGPST